MLEHRYYSFMALYIHINPRISETPSAIVSHRKILFERETSTLENDTRLGRTDS